MKFYLLGGKAAQYQNTINVRPLNEPSIAAARQELKQAIDTCEECPERDMALAVLRETDKALEGIREFMRTPEGREYWRARLEKQREAL